MNETTIETSPKAVAMSCTWSWMLACIPSLPMLFDYMGTRYTLDTDTLHATHGLITKRTNNIDLYRIKSVNAEESLFGGGKVILAMQDGTETKLKFVKDPQRAAQLIRDRVRAEHKDRGIKYREQL